MLIYYDSCSTVLHRGDYVRVVGITDELFRIKEFQTRQGGDAIIENVIPGGRLRTSTIPTRNLVRGINNPAGKPSWWDDTYDAYVDQVAAGTALPCGCYIRAADWEAVLCTGHLVAVNGGSET
jgi:hypothetical protein